MTRWTVARTLGAGALLYLVLVAVGMGITRMFDDWAVIRADARVPRWLADRRTDTLDMLTDIGSTMADTPVAIAVTAVLFLLLRWWLGRWRESLTVLAAIMGELFVFLLVTNTIGRDRPPVPHMDPAPPTSSFPSGHTAAAVALYGCLAIVLLRQMANRTLARVLAVLLFCIPVIVAVSRVYRGMHFPSDVVFGALGGGTWLLLVVLAMMPAAAHGSRR